MVPHAGKCTAPGDACQRSKMTYLCVRQREEEAVALWWVKDNVNVYLLFSADKSSSMLIRALALFAINDKLGERGCQHQALNSQLPNLFSIHPPFYRVVMSAHRNLLRPRNWSHDYEFI